MFWHISWRTTKFNQDPVTDEGVTKCPSAYWRILNAVDNKYIMIYIGM